MSNRSRQAETMVEPEVEDAVREVEEAQAAAADGLAEGYRGAEPEPESEPTPAPPPDADRKALAEIAAAERETGIYELAHIEAAQKAKDARKAWEAAVDRERALIRRLTGAAEVMPLFDGGADGKPDGEAKVDWRGRCIEVLAVYYGLPDAVAAKLREAGIKTIGALADYSNDGGRLEDIKGIGEAAAGQIEDALEAFWQARKDAEDAGLAVDDDPADYDGP